MDKIDIPSVPRMAPSAYPQVLHAIAPAVGVPVHQQHTGNEHLAQNLRNHYERKASRAQGDDTGYGQALFPVPAEDPNDPLQFAAGLIGASRATSYPGLMIARVFHSFGSGVCEALPVQLVNDIFFLHERGKRLGYYTVCLCLGATGPLYAGYMLAGGYSWRLFFYVEFAFAAGLFILAFFFVPETAYKRHLSPIREAMPKSATESDKEAIEEHLEESAPQPPLKSYISTLKPWGSIDHEASFFGTMLRSFLYYLVPPVFWVVTTYGMTSASRE
ncbi:MAG: hypothetical protein Q9227_006808 [Pyrenula ochraceoflavens]